MNRKLIRAVLCAVMVSVLAVGCGGGDSGNADRGEDTGATTPSDDKDAGVKMGFVVGTFEQDFYRTLGSAIERKVQELGVEAIVTDAELDPNVATYKVQDLVAQGCEAIAISCNDAAGVKPAVESADAEGVAMFTFDFTTDSDAVKCFVGPDNRRGGQLGGEELLRYSEDGDTVGMICYPTVPSYLERQNGALDSLEGEDRTVVYDNDYQGDVNKAQQIMQDMLTANPDMSAVFCVGDSAATGALAAIKAAGSDCKIIGFDGNPEAREAIADAEGDGKWWVSEIAQNPSQIGETIVEQMYKYLNDGNVDTAEILIDPYVIDSHNVAEESQ